MPSLIFGKNAVRECLKAKRRRVQEVFCAARQGGFADNDLVAELTRLGVKPKPADRTELDRLAEGGFHQGVVARVGDYVYEELEAVLTRHPEKCFLMMADSLSDPQNLGAMARSAWCFGVDALILAKDRSVEVTPAAIRASAGALEHLPVIKVTNLARTLEQLKEAGFWSYAAVATGGENFDDLDPSPKTVVVIGSEGEGIRPLVLKGCDFRFVIPMKRAFDSLNAAQASTLIAYEFSGKITKN